MPARWLVILLLSAGFARAADAPSPDRVLRVMDFEERRLGNTEDLPMHWTKLDGPGLPHYIVGRLATDQARSGQYSFRLEINGGSLIYRFDPGRILVRPRSHYRVEGYVRTTPLPHARARITAYFVDSGKRPILSSMQRSSLYAAKTADAGWEHLAVELSTDAGGEAHSLVIELELLQPEQYAASTLGEQSLHPQDIRGAAWFDDITVAQVPKVKMSTDRPGNIFRRGEPLSLQVQVNDRSTDDLAAQLLITNAAGQTVYQRSGALDIAAAETLAPGTKRMRLLLPSLPPGWYEAGLVMTSRGQFVGRQKLDLVLLADKGDNAPPDDRFGIIATDLPFDGWRELPEILPLLGTARVKLAVWSKAGDIQQVDPEGFDALLVRLAERGIVPTACLIEPPPAIARKIRGETWAHILKAKTEDWQPQLAVLVSRHANHLDRWQIGADGTDLFVDQKDMREVYLRLYREFAKLIQAPDLAMPWPAWYELADRPATVAMSIPPAILPHQVPLYMQEVTRAPGGKLGLSLQLLERGQYGRETQIRDFAQRVIYALAAGAQRVDLPLPFTVAREDGEIVKQPQEMLMIMRTLLTTLGGATFKGKMPIADGVDAFLFEKDGEGILALWDRGQRGGTRELALSLGERPRALDLWGNATPLLRPVASGRASDNVQLTIGPMPSFLIDIDAQLAQLRASLAVDRPLIESSFQPHIRRIRFTNPYKTALSGSLKLKGPQGWSISPPILVFSANPGETFEREIVLEFPYNSDAGPKTIDAQFSLQDARLTTTNVPLTLTLGLSDVGMQTMAIRDGKDLLVQQMITNYGDRPIDYTAFAVAPGHARQERTVANLGAGRTTIKMYRFLNVGAAPVKLRTGVKEMIGTRILNDEIQVQ